MSKSKDELNDVGTIVVLSRISVT